MAKKKSDQLKEASKFYDIKRKPFDLKNQAELNIQPKYVVNEEGKKTAVIIPMDEWQTLLRKYTELLERLYPDLNTSEKEIGQVMLDSLASNDEDFGDYLKNLENYEKLLVDGKIKW